MISKSMPESGPCCRSYWNETLFRLITIADHFLSEIGDDIRRFSSPAELAAYAGVEPTVKQSGSRMKMSKRGSPCLRRALWPASTVAACKDPAIHALYERKRTEGKDHMTAIGHVCRKVISIIFTVLRDNTLYIPAVISDYPLDFS